MRINQSVGSSIWRYLEVAKKRMDSNLKHISSGRNPLTAAENTVAMAMGERLAAEIGKYTSLIENLQGSISMNQTGEGALAGVSDQLRRLRELTVQAGNETLTPDDRSSIQDEIKHIIENIDQVAAGTEYNSQPVISEMTSANLGIDNINITTEAGRTAALNSIDEAIDLVSTRRSRFGADIQRAENQISSAQIAIENLTATKSRLNDADVAEEIMSLTREKLLQGVGISVFKQSADSQAAILKLLK